MRTCLECNRLKNPTAALMDIKSHEYIVLKESVLLLERVVLHTISFDLCIEHPDKFVISSVPLLTKAQKIEYKPEALRAGKKRSKIYDDLMQKALSFVKDSMCTTLCLQYSSKDIGGTCVYLASVVAGIKPTKEEETWLTLLELPLEVLIGMFLFYISHRSHDVYLVRFSKV